MPKVGDITQSLEDYLETIYLIGKDRPRVHIADVAKVRDVKLPSVVKAVRRLKELNLATQAAYGSVTLTESGSSLARKLIKRHRFLRKFIHDILGVEEDIADRDACAIEHCLNSKTVDALIRYCEKIER